MSFFQNVIEDEFRGNWVLGDRQYSLTFICPANKNKSDYMYAWNSEPYDFSSVNTLTINYAWNSDFKNYSSLSINVAGATPASTKASEVVAALNANSTFAGLFVAQLVPWPYGTNSSNIFSVLITKNYNRPVSFVRTYISNDGAETKLKFNNKAGVADMPLYMNRHTIANRFNYSDSQAMLIKLTQPITAISVAASAQVTSASHGLTNGDTVYIVNTNSTPVIDGQRIVTVIDPNNFTVPVTTTVAGDSGEWLSSIQYNIVTNAGFDYSMMKEDWEILSGRSGLFTFRKLTVDGSDRITEIIEYPAGASAGDLAKKIDYTYTGANNNPDQATEVPYVLQSGDLVTPP